MALELADRHAACGDDNNESNLVGVIATRGMSAWERERP
jgi:hypothetical protein